MAADDVDGAGGVDHHRRRISRSPRRARRTARPGDTCAADAGEPPMTNAKARVCVPAYIFRCIGRWMDEEKEICTRTRAHTHTHPHTHKTFLLDTDRSAWRALVCICVRTGVRVCVFARVCVCACARAEVSVCMFPTPREQPRPGVSEYP
jgi:hypothetical protein